MARLPLVPLSEMPTELLQAMARGRESRTLSNTRPVQVWAHRPPVALAWLQLMETFTADSLLPERLRELVRLKIASITNCQACQLGRKSDEVSEEDIACLAVENDRFSPAEQGALRFAQLFASDYTLIDDSHYAQLANFFTSAQVVELNMYCALMLAGGRMTYVQQAY